MSHKSSNLITPALIGGSLILLIGFGVRASFGVFQIPIAIEFNWARSEFSLALAIQNLAWGFGQPIFGALGEKIGDRRAILIGALVYSLGLVLSSMATTPEAHQWLSILVGFGIAGTGFGVVLAVVGRATSDENRSLALGIATAVGSGGQVVGPPAAEYLLTLMNWSQVFAVFAGVVLLAVLALPFMRGENPATKEEIHESLGNALKKAFKDPSYTLIFIGFFACGYQLSFIAAHFPAFITEICSPINQSGVLAAFGVKTTSALGAVSIALIGLANIFGTIFAGYLGKHYSKKYLLAGIYAARTLVAAMFIIFPMTPATVVIFSLAMGSLWLATIPLTSGLVAHIYGLKYMGTLFGLVFFSHQLGAFVGVWLGGRLYDIYGSYDFVWWVGVAIGAFSAIVHLPIKERRLVPAQ